MMVVFTRCGGNGNVLSVALEVQEETLPFYEYNSEATDEQNEVAEIAVSYIKTSYMSKMILLDQLVEFEGFSTEDAQYAVDHIVADWKSRSSFGEQLPHNR